MFSEQEVTEFINEEFGGEIWGQTVDHSHLIDPPMDQHGPHLYEEVDMQEWQKLYQLSTPMSQIHDWAEPTCLRVKRISTGLGRFYYKAGFYNSWGDDDLKEMSESPASEISPFEIKEPEVVEKPEVVEEPEVLLEEEVKTRMQITLKRQGRNVRGHTGNFVVHRVRASTMVESLSELLDQYPKTRRPEQTVRIQFTEYRIEGGSYVSDRGGNMNLHNAEVGLVIAFITSKLTSLGFSLHGREWKHQAVSRINTKQIIAELPSSVDVPYDRDIHYGLWCLCRVRNGKSWVLSTSEEANDVLEQQNKTDRFTYILSPSGTMYKWANIL